MNSIGKCLHSKSLIISHFLLHLIKGCRYKIHQVYVISLLQLSHAKLMLIQQVFKQRKIIGLFFGYSEEER